MLAECEIEDVKTQQTINQVSYTQALKSIESFCHEQANPKNGGVVSVICPHCNHTIAPQWQILYPHTTLIGSSWGNSYPSILWKRNLEHKPLSSNDQSIKDPRNCNMPKYLRIEWTACTNGECCNVIIKAQALTSPAQGTSRSNMDPYSSPFTGQLQLAKLGKEQIIFPRFAESVIDESIPEPYATEYKEAYTTMQVSEKLSVVGSRKLVE